MTRILIRLAAIALAAFVLFSIGQIDAGSAAAPLLAGISALLLFGVLVVVSRRQARQ